MLNFITDALHKMQGKVPKRKKRSGSWRRIRKEHLKRQPRCQCCEGKKKLEVHHIVPFHVDPSLELVASNLMTLCEAKRYGLTCHQLMGHLGNYRRTNTKVRQDVAEWNQKIKHPKPPTTLQHLVS